MSRTCRIGWADCRQARPHDRARPNTTPGRLSGRRRQRGQRPAIPTCRPADCGFQPREVCFAREKKTATVRSVNYRPHGSAIARIPCNALSLRLAAVIVRALSWQVAAGWAALLHSILGGHPRERKAHPAVPKATYARPAPLISAAGDR